MTYEEIDNTLFTIIQQISGQPVIREKYDQGKRLPLTGEYWDFDAIQLTYLFFAVEKAFSIPIKPEQLSHYGFNTLQQIADMVAVGASV